MNRDIIDFIIKHKINYSKINNISHMMPYQLNPIVSEYRVNSKSLTRMVCIKDIKGFDYEWRKISSSVIDSLDGFFDSGKDTYHSRSVGLLEYDIDGLLDVLKKSYSQEPICLDDMGDNNYVVSSNGLHRYSLLKVHFLNELNKLRTPSEIKALESKFTIPVRVNQVDLYKTYTKYILIRLKKIKNIISHIDSSYNYTKDVDVVYPDGRKERIENNDLLRQLVNGFNITDEEYKILAEDYYIKNVYRTTKSFRDFILENHPSLIKYLTTNTDKNLYPTHTNNSQNFGRR